MTKIMIRPANPSDAKNLSKLNQTLSHFYLSEDASELPTWLANSLTQAQFLTRLISDEYTHFVAESDNQIIGFVAIKHPNHLYHLFVDENYHGQGVGKQLWLHAIDQLDLDSHSSMTVRASLYAAPIYQKFGFVAINDVQEKDGLQFLPMQKIQNLQIT